MGVRLDDTKRKDYENQLKLLTELLNLPRPILNSARETVREGNIALNALKKRIATQ